MIKRIWKKIKVGENEKDINKDERERRKKDKKGRMKRSLLMVAGDKRGEGG